MPFTSGFESHFTEAEPANKSMTGSINIEQIIQDIMADIPLRKKAVVANMDEDKVSYL